jgi:hypothetical protein
MVCDVYAAQVFMLAGPAGSGRSTLARQLLQDFKGKLAPVALLTNRCVAGMQFDWRERKFTLSGPARAPADCLPVAHTVPSSTGGIFVNPKRLSEAAIILQDTLFRVRTQGASQAGGVREQC